MENKKKITREEHLQWCKDNTPEEMKKFIEGFN